MAYTYPYARGHLLYRRSRVELLKPDYEVIHTMGSAQYLNSYLRSTHISWSSSILTQISSWLQCSCDAGNLTPIALLTPRYGVILQRCTPSS